MPAIDKLVQRPTFNSTLVKQAMQEARTDPKAREQLQQLVEQRAGDFEETAQVDHVLQLLTELSKDKFEIVPNRQSGSVGTVEVLEARITKVKDEKVRVDITPPPPPPPSYRRDPLNMTGKAPANSVVEFYSASVPGRPLLGTAKADASGHFSYELTDETKFVFGDQIGVRLQGHDGTKGRPLIVPTEPFLITNTETTYFTRASGTPVDVRTDFTSTQRALDKNTDDRKPFFQAALVDRALEVPSEVEQPYAFTLVGKDDSVEPNSTITVRVGSEEYKTTVDDLGKWALKVRDVAPGMRLSIEVRDINGNGVDIPARVPPIALPAPQLAAAMTAAVDGDGLRVKVADLAPPGGALIARNARTGVVSELVADKQGRLDGVLKGIEPFDSFEIATRDVNGHVSEQTELLVHMPKGVVLAQSLDVKEPDLASALQHTCGPPVDIMVGGKAKPGGPFLPLPALPKLPAHAQLEVVKDGVVVQTLRADANGKLDANGGAGPMLRGVHIGDALSFRLKDAGGRMFPTQVTGFVVPDGALQSKVSAFVPPSLQPLDASRVGSGTLALDPAWLAPARVLVGAHAPTDFQQRHAVQSQVGGAILKQPEAAFMSEHFGGAGASGDVLKSGASVVVTQEQGRKTLTIDTGAPGARGAVSFGFDDTLGTLTPNIAATDLPRLQSALTASLAVVGAAYAQGLERGDVAYDRALGAAKTLLFLLDRFAIANPSEAGAARAAAQAAIGNGPFRFELAPRDVVGPSRKEPIETVTSSAMNLLQARTLAMGDVNKSSALTGASRGAVGVSALSAAAKYDGKTLTFDGANAPAAQGIIAPGDELLVKVGDKDVHRFVADKKGVISGSLDVKPGTVIEIAQRGPDEKKLEDRHINPVSRAVVVEAPILGEGNLVSLDALVQRAPDAKSVAEALLHGGPAPSGLPPGGSVVALKDGREVARVAIDENGALAGSGAQGGVKGSAGDLVDVRILDAAGRPFANVMKDVVIGQSGSGRARIDTDALSITSVLEHVGSGALSLPSFPKRTRDNGYGEREPHEIHADLNPTWGHSSTLENAHGRYSTKAAFPPGLLPDLAKGPEQRRLSLGDSVTLYALQMDAQYNSGKGGGEIKLGAKFFVENQRPDFEVIFDERTGELTEQWSRGAKFAVPGDLGKLTTLLRTSIAFVATAQKLGSEPGDGMYDLAARTAKSTLVIFDTLIQKNPTFRTEILAAVRAAVPVSMPFDLAPVGNAAPTLQVPPTDRQPEKKLAFWSAVHYADSIENSKRSRFDAVDVDMSNLEVRRPNLNATGFFGGGNFFGGTDKPDTRTALPLYLRRG